MTEVIEPTRPRRMFRLPTVYRPKSDTDFLIRTLQRHPIPPGARVLDLCTGAGPIALAAAQFSPSSILAVDISKLAVLTARINAALQKVALKVIHGGIAEAVAHGPFDVVLTNPPYVPCAPGTAELRSRTWDAGPDGRMVLDPICDAAPALLRPDGFMLVVQSEFSGEDATIGRLEANRLPASVVARSRGPLGPVLQSRFGATHDSEELVVIRADRTSH